LGVSLRAGLTRFNLFAKEQQKGFSLASLTLSCGLNSEFKFQFLKDKIA
jgi:hypothetical protein